MERFPKENRWRTPRLKRNTPTGNRMTRSVFLAVRSLTILLFLILTVQLVRLQVIQGEDYKELAVNNALREVPTAASRGLIYDREGRPLVQNVARYSVAIVPGNLPERGDISVYRRVSEVIGMPPEEIQNIVAEHVKKENVFSPVVIKSDLSQETALVLRELEPHLPGVRLLAEATRYYLDSALMAHILGYVGAISEEEYAALKEKGYILQDRVGKAGVELVYEDLLRGTPGRKLIEVDSAGRERAIISEKPAVDGSSISLTIDLDLQRKLRELLTSVKTSSENVAGAVMDVHSGEILAMVSLPEYDNNIFSSAISSEDLEALINAPGNPLVDHTISEMYPPGSTFKTVVGSAALQEGIATPSTTIVSRGSITVPNQYVPGDYFVFRDWAALGALDFYGGLAMSSDVYFYHLAGGYEGFKGLGVQRVADYARAFGLGEPTGIDLPGESAGIIPDPAWKEANIGEDWVLGDTYNMAIGQGFVAMTPLQLLTVAATVANRGEVLQPHLLREARNTHGDLTAQGQKVVRKNVPVDPAFLDVVARGMRQSVTAGVASNAAVRDLAVAAKTGTAEFGERRPDGSYATHGWVMGFAPAADPQVAFVVFFQRGGGGSDAAPTAARMMDYMFEGSNLVAKHEEPPS